MRILVLFRVILVIATAVFMAFHTQIFISRIEPNFIFSWLASLVIEGFLISLALSRTVISRILLVPLFCISVVAASASFVVQNEQLLDDFFTKRRVIEQLKSDLSETKGAYQYGQKYITKTLQRERQLQDDLRAILKDQSGDIALIKSLIFLFFVLIMQSVSIYTAASLKGEKFWKLSKVSEAETESFREVSTETFTENTETFNFESGGIEGDKDCSLIDEAGKKIIVDTLKKRKSEGMTLEELSAVTGVSKSTLSKVLGYPAYQVSEETFKKIASKI